MMRKIGQNGHSWAGARRPLAGVLSPQLLSVSVALGCALVAVGCGSAAQDRNLAPEQVGLTPAVAPIFDDGETQLFEVKRGMQFPIVQPSASQAAALSKQAVEPFGRMPWVTNKDVRVQLTWTLSNLDDAGHTVEILIDPWTEFGRYYPGMQLADAEEQKFEPNSSGIDHYYVLDGKGAGETSRRHGTFTFDDMNEMAIDFSTVQAMIKNPPPLPNGVKMDPGVMVDPLPIYANHAFNLINHSYNDPLIAPYIPTVIAGLTGIDFGFRTTEKATIALDIEIEILDVNEDHVQLEGGKKVLLEATQVVVTVGSAVPAAK